MPLIFSVASEEEAMALPHPNVLNLASMILPTTNHIAGNQHQNTQTPNEMRPVSPTGKVCLKRRVGARESQESDAWRDIPHPRQETTATQHKIEVLDAFALHGTNEHSRPTL